MQNVLKLQLKLKLLSKRNELKLKTIKLNEIKLELIQKRNSH